MFTSDSPKADCVYGPSGTGKTTMVGRLARFVFKKTHKVTRLISADPGGWKAVDPYVALNVIQPFSLLDDRVIAPLETMTRLVQGYWPFDPVTGEPLLRVIKAPNTPLDGKSVFDFTNVKARPTPETWQKVGGIAVEGMHSISVFISNYLSANPHILNELAGGAGSKQGNISQIRDGSDVYVQPGQASYGFVQKKMYDLVRQSCDLPVEKVLWTSLEALYEVKDKDGNVVATEHYYPSIIGKAALRATPQWFGMLMHLETVQVGVTAEDRPDKAKRLANVIIGTTETEVRAYLRDHLNPKDGLLYKAKARVPIEVAKDVPAMFKVTLSATGPGVHDLCSLYELEDRLHDKATSAVANDLGLADIKEVTTV